MINPSWPGLSSCYCSFCGLKPSPCCKWRDSSEGAAMESNGMQWTVTCRDRSMMICPFSALGSERVMLPMQSGRSWPQQAPTMLPGSTPWNRKYNHRRWAASRVMGDFRVVQRPKGKREHPTHFAHFVACRLPNQSIHIPACAHKGSKPHSVRRKRKPRQPPRQQNRGTR